MTLNIRNSGADDEPRWRELWASYCAFYGAEVSEAITQATWQRIMAQPARIGCRLAEMNGQVVGFAHHVMHEGTWVQTPIAYLEDLFVTARAREHGIGKALIDDLLNLARSNGWSRVYWHTESTNETARRLYDRYVQADGFVRYRIGIAP